MENRLFDSLCSEMYPRMDIEIGEERKKEINLFLEHGFVPYFSFYGENNMLKPNMNWLAYYGKQRYLTTKNAVSYKDFSIVVCLGKNPSEYTVFKNGKKIGVFNDAEDIFSIFEIGFCIPMTGKLEAILDEAGKLINNEEFNDKVEKYAAEYREKQISKLSSSPHLTAQELR